MSNQGDGIKGTLAVVKNLGQLALCVLATFYDQVWAARRVYFYAALNFLGGLVCYSGEGRKLAATLPRWRVAMSRAADVPTILILVAFGFWWTAIAFTFSALSLEIALGRNAEEEEPE